MGEKRQERFSSHKKRPLACARRETGDWGQSAPKTQSRAHAPELKTVWSITSSESYYFITLAVYCPIEDRAIGQCKKIMTNGQTPCVSREKSAARQNWRDATYSPSVARATIVARVHGGAEPRHLAERLPYGRGRDAPCRAQGTDAAETHGQAQAQNDIPIAGRESGANDRPKRAGTRPHRYAVAPKGDRSPQAIKTGQAVPEFTAARPATYVPLTKAVPEFTAARPLWPYPLGVREGAGGVGGGLAGRTLGRS